VIAAGVIWSRMSGPTWSAAVGEAVAIGSQLDATIRRILDDEAGRLADTAGRAAKVPHIANAITGRVDEETFQDLLANELWWSEFRSFGCAVLVGDQLKVAWHLPVPNSAAVALVKAVRPGAGGGARAALVSDAAGNVLGAVATIEGVGQGRLLLARPVDRALVTDLASRANTVLMLSDGKHLLGISVPENTIPEIGLLVGREESHVLVDRRHGRLAAAVPWSRSLWLWGVTGWTS
jgi:DNA-binding transcriptional regulator YdaS (Cro superfamily)